MKKDEKLPITNEVKRGKGSNPVNKFKKGSKGATISSVDNIITSAVESVKAKSGKGLSNEGSTVDYNEEQ